ncbi:hypothetical protein [Sphingopyxis sp. GW247-27LB]|uniref:hypothetical protein n=1 Tax=Sphingopyxis sp. GW247-27LB TaxID=2012632 RepID=UPI000BA71AE7|nr:hypothetical protein [Sphingopyxis sp. GW247-27LB]PAL24532.1 hypothetical protein CD928_03800 [Sphingopyxis sp. GW247-27LB]
MSARMAVYVGRGVSLPADIALSLIPSLPRPHLERLVQQLIDRLDDGDGDPDLEDETDHSASEDDAMPLIQTGPGCSIADPDISTEELWEFEQ